MSAGKPFRRFGELRTCRSPRSHRAVPIEALEGRTLLSGGTAADRIIQSATTPNSRSVMVVYDVVGAALGSPVSLRIDRAATASGTGGDRRAMTVARAPALLEVIERRRDLKAARQALEEIEREGTIPWDQTKAELEL